MSDTKEVMRAIEVAVEACRVFSRPGGLVNGAIWDKYEGAAATLERLAPFVEAALEWGEVAHKCDQRTVETAFHRYYEDGGSASAKLLESYRALVGDSDTKGET